MKRIACLMVGVLVLAVAGCNRESSSGTAAEVALTGAGSTFAKPIYDKWAATYTAAHPNVRLNYQGIGSSGGINQIVNKTVDFGATDGPMTEAQLGRAPGMIVHIPTVLGAVVPIYNLPDVSRPLVFNGQVLAALYLGKITRWNDPKLIALNPGANLPDRPVTTVHRSDGSGTTYIFTDYLSKVSSAWESGPGHSTEINWPAGRGAKGNDGVAADVKQNPGSLGYVELIYAANNKIAYGDLVNAAGKTIHASVESVSAAALQNIPDDLRVSITNAPGDTAYPISSLTWILAYQQQTDAAKGKALVDFLWWAIHDGQTLAGSMFYAPLPKEFVPRVEKKLQSITSNGHPLLEQH
jgi:phosphate transport system substrate-binding protein